MNMHVERAMDDRPRRNDDDASSSSRARGGAGGRWTAAAEAAVSSQPRPRYGRRRQTPTQEERLAELRLIGGREAINQVYAASRTFLFEPRSPMTVDDNSLLGQSEAQGGRSGAGRGGGGGGRRRRRRGGVRDGGEKERDVSVLSIHPSSSSTSQPSVNTSPSLHPSFHRLWLLFALFLVLLLAFEGCLAQEILEVKFEVEEEVALGTLVGDVVAEAGLVKLHGLHVVKNQLQFRFLKQQHALGFQLDQTTGILRTGARIDRDAICPGFDGCSVRLDVAVQPVDFFRIIRVTVVIRDVNDNSPSFLIDGKVVFDVLETAALGTGLVVPSAVDVDSPKFSVQKYSLFDDGTSSATPFELREIRKGSNESIELRLVLIKSLDRESVASYDLTIGAVDGGTPPRSGSVSVLVNIVDVNDNSPVFERDSYSVTVAENIPRLTTLLTVRAFDADSGPNGQVVYEFPSMTASSYGHLFSVGNVSGQVVVIESFDYELIQVYHLVIVARDLGPDAVHSTVSLTVQVEDVNDNAPEISIDTLAATPGTADIDEGLPAGAFVALVSVTDRDSGPNGQFNCSLSDPQFSLKTYGTEFHIVTAAVLDRELQATYNLALVCADFGDDQQASVEHVTVRVTDVNDLEPVFRQTTYYGELIENNYVGAVVFQVNATDGDLGPNADVSYEIDGAAGNSFEIDPATGLVKALVSLDHEMTEHIRFYIVARDNGSPSRSSSAAALVTILDINDERPKFTLVSYSFRVDENEPPGTSVGTVKAHDADSGPSGHVTYSMQSGPSSELFTVDRSSGAIKATASLDREVQSAHHLVVTATDLGVPPLTSTAKLTIQVGDQNDNAPQFGGPFDRTNASLFVSTAATIGHLVTKVTALDADAGVSAKINYEISTDDEWKELFQIDAELGMLTVASSLDELDGATVDLTVTASDSGHPAQSSVMRLFVSINSSVPYQHLKGETVVGGITGGAGKAGAGGIIIPVAIRYNLAVVVSLAVISGLVTTCLVTAIACVRRQDSKKQQRHPHHQHHQHQYDDCGGRMESLKVISRGQGHAGAEVMRSNDADESSSGQSTPARTKRSRTDRKEFFLSNGSLLVGSQSQVVVGSGTKDSNRSIYQPNRDREPPLQQVAPLSSSVAAAAAIYQPISTCSKELEARNLLHVAKESETGTGGGGGGAGGGGRGGGSSGFYGDRISVHSAEGSDSGRGTTSEPEADASVALGFIRVNRRSPPNDHRTMLTSQLDPETPGGFPLSHSRLLTTVPEDVTSNHDNEIAIRQLLHSRAINDRGATFGRFRPLATTGGISSDSETSREIIYVANLSQDAAASPLLARERFTLTTRIHDCPAPSGEYMSIQEKPCGDSGLHTTFARWQQQTEAEQTMRFGDREIATPGEYCDIQYQILLQSGRSSTV